jgi:fumarate reductase subunit D
VVKRSNEPLFWALFGAGGMLSALVGPVLVFVTGIALPLGWLLPPAAWNHARMLALAQQPLAKFALLALVSLFLFHGCHRLLHSLHDLGLHTGRVAAIACYGFATLATVAAAGLLLRIGF